MKRKRTTGNNPFVCYIESSKYFAQTKLGYKQIIGEMLAPISTSLTQNVVKNLMNKCGKGLLNFG